MPYLVKISLTVFTGVCIDTCVIYQSVLEKKTYELLIGVCRTPMYSTRAFCKKRPELQIWSSFLAIHM